MKLSITLGIAMELYKLKRNHPCVVFPDLTRFFSSKDLLYFVLNWNPVNKQPRSDANKTH